MFLIWWWLSLVSFAVKECDALMQNEDDFGDFEEKYFGICFLKCQNYIATHCAKSMSELSPINIGKSLNLIGLPMCCNLWIEDTSVLEKGTSYCCDSALQICYDSLVRLFDCF